MTLIAVNAVIPEEHQARLVAALMDVVASRQQQLAGTPQEGEGCVYVLASTLLQKSKGKGGLCCQSALKGHEPVEGIAFSGCARGTAMIGDHLSWKIPSS